jgi:hypothetical protein
MNNRPVGGRSWGTSIHPSIQWRYSPNRTLAFSKHSLPRHLLRFRNNDVLRCGVVSLTTNPRHLWGTVDGHSLALSTWTITTPLRAFRGKDKKHARGNCVFRCGLHLWSAVIFVIAQVYSTRTEYLNVIRCNICFNNVPVSSLNADCTCRIRVQLHALAAPFTTIPDEAVPGIHRTWSQVVISTAHLETVAAKTSMSPVVQPVITLLHFIVCV